jgi:N6-adenosine-specific RNA methylase IME4
MEFHLFANIFPLMEGTAFDALREDIKKNGVREPLTTLDDMLLDGRNRFNAAVINGDIIPPEMFRVFDPAKQGDPLAWVISMNLQRRHLNESQRADVAAQIANMPQGARTDLGPIGLTSQADSAKMLNVSVRSIKRATAVRNNENTTAELQRAVVQGHIPVSVAAMAANLPKDQQRKVAAEAATGKVTALLRKISKQEDEARIRLLEPVVGKFPTLVIDPPWNYEFSFVERAAPDYATMAQEELLALDVGQWASDDCALYLWTTNAFMMRAGELMARWGFGHKTIITWVKPRIGLGTYFRNTTEHVLFGTRGNVRIRREDIPTHFEAPITGHSNKPEKFYKIVRAASYPAYGEIFQREPRPDFKNLYEPSGRRTA